MKLLAGVEPWPICNKNKIALNPQKETEKSEAAKAYTCPISIQTYLGTNPPPRMPVTTRIIPFLVGNPYKPLLW